MAINNFKPFSTGASANVITQAVYEALPALSAGFQSGIAKSNEVNKPLRQSTTMAAVLGQYIADTSGEDVLDDGLVPAKVTSLTNAIRATASAVGIDWVSTATYPVDKVVSRNGVIYKAVVVNTNSPPPSVNWVAIANSISIQYWEAARTYTTDNVVLYNRLFYLALNTNVNSAPPSVDWREIGAGAISKSLASGSITLAASEFEYPVITLTGALTANVTVTVPSVAGRRALFINATTGAFTVTLKTATDAGFVLAQGFSVPTHLIGTVLSQSGPAYATATGNLLVPGSVTANSFIGNATSATAATVTTTAANAEYPFVLSPDQTTGTKGLLMDSTGGTYNPSTNTATINVTGSAGTAGTATNANNVAVAADTTNVSRYLTFVAATSGNNAVQVSTALVYNPSTNTLTASLNGNAASASKVTVTTTAANAEYPLVLSNTQATGTRDLLMDDTGGTYNPSTNTATINISGNAATATNATNATNATVTTTAANAEYPFVLSPNQTTGTKGLLMDSAGGTYNPSTNTATINISGNAATAGTATNVSGGSASVTTLNTSGNATLGSGGTNTHTVNGSLTVTNGITVGKNGSLTSSIDFPAQTNDAGYIRHTENNNASQLDFCVSDDFTDNDKLRFGGAPGGTFVPVFEIGAGGSFQSAVPGIQALYPDYSCRMWVNFNGTGAVGAAQSIRGSGNVSSITKIATGNFQLNFSSPLPDANYAIFGTGSTNAFTGFPPETMVLQPYEMLTTSFKFGTIRNNDDLVNSQFDYVLSFVSVFR